MNIFSNFRWLSLALLSICFVLNADLPSQDLVARGEERGGGERGGGERSRSGQAGQAAQQHPNAAYEHHNTPNEYHGSATHSQEARAYERGAENSAGNNAGAGSVYVVPQDPNLQYNPNGGDNWGQ